MSKVAETGDKRSEKRNQIGKSGRTVYHGKKKLYPPPRKTQRGVTGKV